MPKCKWNENFKQISNRLTPREGAGHMCLWHLNQKEKKVKKRYRERAGRKKPRRRRKKKEGRRRRRTRRGREGEERKLTCTWW